MTQRGSLQENSNLKNFEPVGNDFQARPGFWLQGQLTIGESQGLYRALKICLKTLKLGNFSIQNELRRNQYDAIESNLVPPEVGDSVISSQSALLSELFNIPIQVLSISEYEKLKPISVTDKNGMMQNGSEYQYKPLVSRVTEVRGGVPTYTYLIHCSIVENDKLLERAIKWCFAKKWQDEHPESKLVKNIRKLCATSLAGFNGAGSIDSFVDNVIAKMILRFPSRNKEICSIHDSIQKSHLNPPISCEVILKNYEAALRVALKGEISESDLKKRLKEDAKIISSAYIVAYVEYGMKVLKRSGVPFFVHATRFADIVSKSEFAPDAHMVAAALLSRLNPAIFSLNQEQEREKQGADPLSRIPEMTLQQRSTLLTDLHLQWVRRDVSCNRESHPYVSAKNFLLESKKFPLILFFVEKLGNFRAQSFYPLLPKDIERPDYSARWWSDAYLLRTWERVEAFFAEERFHGDQQDALDVKKNVFSSIILLTLGETLQRLRNSSKSKDNKHIIDLTTLLSTYTAERIGAETIASKLRFAVHRLDQDAYNQTKKAHTDHLGISEIASSALQKALTNQLSDVIAKSGVPCECEIYSRVKGYYSSHEKSEREIIEGLRDGVLSKSQIGNQFDLIGLTCLVKRTESEEDYEKLRHYLTTCLGPLTIDCKAQNGFKARIDVVSSDDKQKGIVFQRTNFNLNIRSHSILKIYEQEFHLPADGSLTERALRVLNVYNGDLKREILGFFVNEPSTERYYKELRTSDFVVFKDIENIIGRQKLINVCAEINTRGDDIRDVILSECTNEEAVEVLKILERSPQAVKILTNSGTFESYLLDSGYQEFWSVVKETLDLTLLGDETPDVLVGKVYRALKAKCGVDPENTITSLPLFEFLSNSHNHSFTFALRDFLGLPSKHNVDETIAEIFIQLGMGPRLEIQITDQDNFIKGKHNNSPAKYQNAHANLKVRDEWVRKMLIEFLQNRYRCPHLHSLTDLVEATLYGYPDRIAETSQYVQMIYDRYQGQQFDKRDPKKRGLLREDIYSLGHSLAEIDKAQVFVVELMPHPHGSCGKQFPVKLPQNACAYDLLTHVKIHEALEVSNVLSMVLERFDESTQHWRVVSLFEKLNSLERLRVRATSSPVYDQTIPKDLFSVCGRLASRVDAHITSINQHDADIQLKEAIRSARKNLFSKLEIDEKYLSEEFVYALEKHLLNYSRQFGLSDIDQVFLAMYYNISPVTVEDFKKWCSGNFISISSRLLLDDGGFAHGFDIVVDEEQVGIIQKILSHPLLQGVNLESASISDTELNKEGTPRALHLRFRGENRSQTDEIMRALVTNLPYSFIGRGSGHITIFPKTVGYELILEDKPGVLNQILGIINSFNISILDIQTSKLIPGTNNKKVTLKLALPESEFSFVAKSPLLRFNPATTIEPLFGLHSEGFTRVGEVSFLFEKPKKTSNLS